MILNKSTIQCIKEMAEHYQDQICTHDESLQLEQLYDLCNDIPIRFHIEIKRIDKIPETNDIIVNYIVKELLVFLENDKQEIDLENALWDYLKVKYKFDAEEHYLLKHTTEEALEYAFKYINIIKNESV